MLFILELKILGRCAKTVVSFGFLSKSKDAAQETITQTLGFTKEIKGKQSFCTSPKDFELQNKNHITKISKMLYFIILSMEKI